MPTDDIVTIHFMPAEHAARTLVQEGDTLLTESQRLQRSMGYFLGAGFQAAFRAEVEARWFWIQGQLKYLSEEITEAGQDLQTAVERFRQLDDECAAYFGTWHITPFPFPSPFSPFPQPTPQPEDPILGPYLSDDSWSIVNTGEFSTDELLVQIGGSCTIYGIMNLLVEEGINITPEEAEDILNQLSEKYGRTSGFPISAAEDILKMYGVDYTRGDFKEGEILGLFGSVNREKAEQFLIDNLSQGNSVYVSTEVDDSFGGVPGQGHAYTVIGVKLDANGKLERVLVATNWPDEPVKEIPANAFMDDWINRRDATFITVP